MLSYKKLNFTTKNLSCILLAIILIADPSCKKSSSGSSGSTYYIKLKINGTWQTWEGTNAAGELGPDLGDPNYIDLGVTGSDKTGKSTFDLTIQKAGDTIPTGIYASDVSASAYTIDVSFSDLSTLSNTLYYDIQSVSGKPPAKYTITISEITGSTLKGSFTGNYLTENFDMTNTISLTDGDFYVKRIR